MSETTERKEYLRQRYLRNREAILERTRQRYQDNKELRLQQIAKWQKANPEKVKAIQRKSNIKHADKRRRLWADWYSKNGHAYREKRANENRLKYQSRRDQQKTWWKKYYSENKAKLSLRVMKRRALKKKASVNLKGIKNFILGVRTSKFVSCYYCGDRISGHLAHFDHIVPLAKGGQHSADNLCVSCPTCNLSKKDRTPQAWIKVGQQLLAL